MKTLVIALNSKYIHASLAPWYLKAACGDEFGQIKVLEFTINDSIDNVLASIFLEKPDITAFSCYIWNVSQILKISECLKKVLPETKIIFGGPEVSFDAYETIELYSSIDFIISGEGEKALKQLISYICTGLPGLSEIEGIIYKTVGGIKSNNLSRFIENLDSIPSPYTDEMISSIGNRIVYFESSRGCPFSCSYCISSTVEGVRHFSMERVKSDILKLVDAGVKQIKFVDRTFNCNKQRAKEIFRFIIELGRVKSEPENHNPAPKKLLPNFHFEAAADLFDDEMLDILSAASPGLIQFEIGIQTTNIRTLELIHRRTDLDKVFHNIKKLNEYRNIHLHLDLIAGLPAEDYKSFKNSFNAVYNLEPHQLQLGFLKMLKGSLITKEAELHSYKFRDFPPYEVLNSMYISYEEMLLLKNIEEIVERYYNSGRFVHSLKYVISRFFNGAFEFYSEFSSYCKTKGYLDRPLSGRESYSVFIEFANNVLNEETSGKINDLLKLDFLSSDNTNNLPEGMHRLFEKDFKDRCFEFLKEDNNVREYLPDFLGVPSKHIFKQVHFEIFRYDIVSNENSYFKEEKTVVLFNYNKKDRVTGLYNFQKVNLQF